MTNYLHQFTRDAWEANAEVWDARMGDEGNDFFKMAGLPECNKTLLTHALFHIVPQTKNVSVRGDNLFYASCGARDAIQEQKACRETTP